MFTTKDLQIRPSRIHGLGVFAVAAIPAETRVLEYVGKRLTNAEADMLRDKTYCFRINDEYSLDGAGAVWNPACFFNHCCEPNCVSCLIDERIWIITQRDIKPDEELTFNYGYPFEDYLKHPCRCGTPGCVGYIVAEEFFPEIKRLRGKG